MVLETTVCVTNWVTFGIGAFTVNAVAFDAAWVNT
jgi:hypothetical protein